MNEQEVRERAFAKPIMNPTYPRPPIRFVDRELVLIHYRTDPKALACVGEFLSADVGRYYDFRPSRRDSRHARLRP